MRIQSLHREMPADAAPQPGADAVLGRILVEAGELSQAEADKVAERQRTTAMSFGQTAIAMGFASQEAIDRALARQFDFSIVDRGSSKLDPKLTLANGWKDAKSEAIRSLRAKLWLELASGFGPAPPAVTVAGAGVGEAQSLFTANLAIAFAQAGIRTLLIDGQLRAPRLHSLFGLGNQAGLSTWLARRQPAPAVMPVGEIRGLALLPAGPMPPNPQELLAKTAPAMTPLREAWKAELILFDAPPLDNCDDAYSIAAAAPAVLMLARRNLTQQKPLADAARQFGSAGARIVGAVLDVA